MIKSRKAGCMNYADVSNDYMLYDKAVTKSGGTKKKSGGTFMDDMVKQSSQFFNAYKKTAGCTNCSNKKGGGIELAPFAAALAFLATRFATDKNFKLPKSKSSKSKSSSAKLSSAKLSSSKRSI